MEIFPFNGKFPKNILIAKTPYCHGRFSKNGSFAWQVYQKILFSWEIFTYGNISVALMIKIPMLLRNFFSHVSDTITQSVLGIFPIMVTISMTISNREVMYSVHKDKRQRTE
jgi:hypothetical protein